MAQIIKEKRLLDKDFNPLPQEHQLDEQKDLVVVEVVQYEKNLLNKKEVSRDYAIIQGDTQVVIDRGFMNQLKKHRTADAETFFKKMVAENPGQQVIKPGRGKHYLFTWLAGILAVALIGSAAGAYFLLTSEKNFTGSTIQVTAANAANVKPGDYVEVDVPVLDYVEIEETTTRTTYGVKTGESKAKGNSYILSFFPPLQQSDKVSTFIYRYAPVGEVNAKFSEVLDDETPMVKSVKGEVRNTSDIERLDGTQQIESYFNAQLQENLPEVSKVSLYIDGRVTPGDMNFVWMVTAALAALGIVALVPTALFWKKYQEYMQNLFKPAGELIS